MPAAIAGEPSRRKQPTSTVSPRRMWRRPVSIISPTDATAITAMVVATVPSMVFWSQSTAVRTVLEP